MLRRVLMMLVLCWLGPLGFGQETYRAVFSGGRVYIASENRFSHVSNGQVIASDARVELVGNAMLVLMDAEGRLKSLEHAGKYNLADLNMQAATDSSLFIKSIWEEYYAHISESFSVEEQLLQDAVIPGFGGLEFVIPTSSQVFGNRAVLSWSNRGFARYQVQLINEFEEVFKTINTAQNQVTLDFFEPDLVWKRELTLRVLSGDGNQQSPLYTLRKLSPPDYESMDRLMKTHFTENSLVMKLSKAAFFENQWLFADAQTLLSDLSAQYGEVMSEFWNRYLIRNGLYAISRQ